MDCGESNRSKQLQENPELQQAVMTVQRMLIQFGNAVCRPYGEHVQ